jgi:hypothetical protein
VLWLAFNPASFEWNAVATLTVFAMTLSGCAESRISHAVIA